MARALAALGECRFEGERGGELASGDLNARDAVLGLEMSPLTTSLGNLPSKRTSIDPNFAGLIVFLLRRKGSRMFGTLNDNSS